MSCLKSCLVPTTISLLCLPLLIGSTVYTSLEDFILTLELVLILVFEFLAFPGHGFLHWTFARFKGNATLVFCCALGHLQMRTWDICDIAQDVSFNVIALRVYSVV